MNNLIHKNQYAWFVECRRLVHGSETPEERALHIGYAQCLYDFGQIAPRHYSVIMATYSKYHPDFEPVIDNSEYVNMHMMNEPYANS